MMHAFNETRQTVIASSVDQANTALSRMKGLLGKPSMGENNGLLITPGKSIHTFFMKFPIDVMFLSPSNQVIKLINAMGPFRLSPLVPSAKSVLELSTGTIEKSGTQIGDQVIFRT